MVQRDALVERPEVDEAVVVFWNVNAKAEFSYYRHVLALAADVAGVVVGANFLQRRLLVAVDDLD